MNASPQPYCKQKGAIALIGAYSFLPLIMIVLFLLDFSLMRISSMQLQLAVDSCALAGASALANKSPQEAEVIAIQYCLKPPILAAITKTQAKASYCSQASITSGAAYSNTSGANCMFVSITAKLLNIGQTIHSFTTTSAAKMYPQPSDPEQPRISRAFLIPSVVHIV